MLSQKCHNNHAKVRYSEVVDGKVTELHLCSECLSRHQEEAATGFELAGSAPAPKLRALTPQATVAQRTCETCGTELKAALETGRVGCSVCYAVFRTDLEPVLQDLHVSVRHSGKVPRLDDKRERVRAELQTKRALLRTSLQMENDEEAAILRDEIRHLEVGLGAAESGQD